MKWGPYPLVRTLFFFAVGIASSVWLTLPASTVLWILSALLPAYGIIYLLQRRYELRATGGFVALIAVLFAGYLSGRNANASLFPRHLYGIDVAHGACKVQIVSDVVEKPDWFVATAEVNSVRENGAWRRAEGKAILYFRKTSSVHYGDIFLLRDLPSGISPPMNPGEFDYQKIMRYRNVYYRAFLDQDDYQFIGHETPNILYAASYSVRNYVNDVITTYVPGEREAGIVKALVIGIREDLDRDLMDSYADAGAMHILAVSGLHVGIIYWIFLFITRPLKGRSVKLFLSVLGVLILWSYAFATGFSPSVVRAVTMFTFFGLAALSSRETNSYNVLAASAICQLAIDPFLLFSVGFQLSYCAVFGILYLFPILFRLWIAPSVVTNRLWQLVCISIVAQTATFPLALFYFHQFPVYFLIGNMVAVPSAFVILILGIVMIVVSPIAMLAKGIGFMLNLVVLLLNEAITMIRSLPFAVADHVYLSAAQFWFLEVVVVFTVMLLVYRRYRYLMIAGIGVLCLSALAWGHVRKKPATLVVYCVPGHSAMDLFEGRNGYTLCDSSLMDDLETIEYNMTPFRAMEGEVLISRLQDQPFCRAAHGAVLLEFGGTRVVEIQSRAPGREIGSVDYLIVSNNAVADLKDIRNLIEFDVLILDSSNSISLTDRLMKQANDSGIEAHDIRREGAFITFI